MLQNLKKLLLVSRPISWPNTAYPFAAGYVISGGAFDVFLIVGTLFFLIPYNLLMYGINDIFDYESDIRNPRKGGIEGAKEQKALHPLIWWGVAISTIPFVIWLVWYGTLVSNITLIAVLFFVVAYSLKYLRFKEIPLLDSITSSLHFVGPLIFALSLTGFAPAAWPYILAFFLWGMASHAFGAVQDIIPDRAGKLASIATVLGATATVRLVVILYSLSAVIVIAQGWPALLVGLAGMLYVANVAPFISVTDKHSASTNKAWRRFIWLNFITGFIVTMVLLGISL